MECILTHWSLGDGKVIDHTGALIPAKENFDSGLDWTARDDSPRVPFGRESNVHDVTPLCQICQPRNSIPSMRMNQDNKLICYDCRN